MNSCSPALLALPLCLNIDGDDLDETGDVSVQISFPSLVTNLVRGHLLSIWRCHELSPKEGPGRACAISLPLIFRIFCGDNLPGVVYIAFGFKLYGGRGMGQEQTGGHTPASKVIAVRSLHER